jgi:C1A family cysteine protease
MTIEEEPVVKLTFLSVETPVVKKKVAGKTRHLYGWRPDRPDHRDTIMTVPSHKLTLALSLDLSSVMSKVEDQSDIGSCVCNASTTCVEFLYPADKRPDLSRLSLYYWTRFLDGTAPENDSGTYVRTAMKALAAYGPCLESLWPYDIAKYNIKPAQPSIDDGQKRQILRYYRTPTLTHIKLCLAEGFPIVFGFSVPESLFSDETYKTGIVKYPTKKEAMVGGHAVLCVGYNEATKLLKFQNSWSTAWGDKGFGYLPYRYVTDGLASDFWTIRSSKLG